MPATRLFIPRMEIADPNTNAAYLWLSDPGEGRQAMDHDPDNIVKSNPGTYAQYIWDIDPFSGSGSARFSCNWAGMFVVNPSAFANVGKVMHIRTSVSSNYLPDTLRAVRTFTDNTTAQPIFVKTFAATTDRFWMLEVKNGTPVFMQIGCWFAGTYFDVEARWNNDMLEGTTGFFNRTPPIGGGRHYSRAGTSAGVKRWVRRFEAISGVDMQALRDAHALAHGSRVPFIMSDNPDNAAEGYLVRFDESVDEGGLGERRHGSDIWTVDVPLVEVPWVREGALS